MLLDALRQSGLSNRETEVARWVSRGLCNKDVAKRLFVTEKTVKFHLTSIYKKLRIKNRAQLVVWCIPHLTFEEKNDMPHAWDDVASDGDQLTMPIGITKVGNA